MKSINKMAVAAMLAVSSAGLASAQTYHVTGSTAYRVADVTAEVAVCGGATAKATFYGGSVASPGSLTGSNYSVVTNSTGSLKFENYFNGSIAGDEALVDGVTLLPFPTATDFPPTTVTTAGSSAAPATGGTSKPAPANNTLAEYATESVAPDIAFSDVSFPTADQIIKKSTDATNAQPAGSAIVGIVPFVFICNGSADVTNLGTPGLGQVPVLSMDPQKFTNVWASGASATLSFFTGLNADEATTVFPLGRDADSGTRATALAETGYFLNGSGIVTTPVAQFFPYNSTANATADGSAGVIGNDGSLVNPTIFGLNAVPAESIDGYPMPLGDGGYNSGGNLAVGMSTVFDASVTNTVLMTYVGVSDAKAALNAANSGSVTDREKATLMAYNGVAFYPASPYPGAVTAATNAALIYEGKYTFWAYEHEFYNNSASSVATSLKNALSVGAGALDQLSSNGVTFPNMKVSRSDDGQLVH